MSKAAVTFLILTIMALAVEQLLPVSAQAVETIAQGAVGIFGILFVAALVVGRNIKFDPVFRQAKH